MDRKVITSSLTCDAPQGENMEFKDRITGRPDRRAYGMGLGIILLDDVYPGFPGDVRNASAWPFPVQYEVAEGVDIYRLVDPANSDRDPCFEPILKAAKKLERLGCRAIAAECGFFCYFQRTIADQLTIPVYMSSLLQVPWAAQTIAKDRTVAILTGSPDTLTDAHLGAVGISSMERIRIHNFYSLCGEDYAEFHKLWNTRGRRTNPPSAAFSKAEREMVRAALQVIELDPTTGAFVLECTGYPPFARSVQSATELPVYSWGTLLEFAYSTVVHRSYHGHV